MALAFGACLALALPAPVSVRAQSFSNDDLSCNQYGDWAVAIMLLAKSQGCDMAGVSEWLVPARHTNWCRGQSLATMTKAPEVHRNNVLSRCYKQGVKVRINA